MAVVMVESVMLTTVAALDTSTAMHRGGRVKHGGKNDTDDSSPAATLLQEL